MHDAELLDWRELLSRQVSGPGYARGGEFLVIVVPFGPGQLPPTEHERMLLAEMGATATRNIVDMCKPSFLRTVGAKRLRERIANVFGGGDKEAR